MGLIAGVLESQGVATVVVSCFEPIMEQVGAPRRLALPYPLGFPLGMPGQVEDQFRVLREALSLARAPGPAPVIRTLEP